MAANSFDSAKGSGRCQRQYGRRQGNVTHHVTGLIVGERYGPPRAGGGRVELIQDLRTCHQRAGSLQSTYQLDRPPLLYSIG